MVNDIDDDNYDDNKKVAIGIQQKMPQIIKI